MTTLRVVTEPLGGSPLAAAAIAGTTPSGWYEPMPDSPSAWKARADAIRSEAMTTNWLANLAPAFNASGAARDRLQRSADGAGIVVTTGQQPGLFGGPLYALSKALSALAFADALQEHTGVPVAPVFWAATDDADFAEASSTVVAVAGGPRTIHLKTGAPPGTPMAQVPLGDLSDACATLAQAAGSGSHAVYLDAVRRTYVPTATIGGAYVQLMRALLEDLGIAVLDASHPAVTASGDQLLRVALRAASDVDAALQRRSAELHDAGHTPQVALVRGLSLVFGMERGIKRRIPFTESESAASSVARGGLAPNVLLRPVVERAILPTAAYVAGPGEIAYFAQVSAVAATLGASSPLAVPRWSGTVIEPHIARILERYHLAHDDLRDPHAAETRVALSEMPAAVVRTLNALRKDISSRIEELSGEDAPGASLLPAKVINGARHTLEHRIDRLERRFLAAQKRRSEAALADIATARGALFPNGKRQERALNAIPMLARHGSLLLDGMLQQARAHAAGLLAGARSTSSPKRAPTSAGAARRPT